MNDCFQDKTFPSFWIMYTPLCQYMGTFFMDDFGYLVRCDFGRLAASVANADH